LTEKEKVKLSLGKGMISREGLQGCDRKKMVDMIIEIGKKEKKGEIFVWWERQ